MLEERIFFAADNMPSLGAIPHFCISSTLAFNTQRIVLDSHCAHTNVVLEEQKARLQEMERVCVSAVPGAVCARSLLSAHTWG